MAEMILNYADAEELLVLLNMSLYTATRVEHRQGLRKWMRLVNTVRLQAAREEGKDAETKIDELENKE